MSATPPAVPTNSLIQATTADTLTACVSVLNFTLDALGQVEMEAPSVRDGAAWVQMLVVEALDYESQRAAAGVQS